MKTLLEIKTYELKPGTRDKFHRIVSDVSYPLMRQWNIEVVDFGPSMHDENSYFLIRAYQNLAERASSQDAFYGSDAWRNGPRESIIALIENEITVTMRIPENSDRQLIHW